ncbi:hypothetical protein PsYK624_131850 [Phanerochaete sordida]|uniref:Uncharacterized protein n=1 Tax=Phanerochaete sordida TaxID=48140 RepID=A0A9P3GP41_9APHY|nr:hypothetical protein PsYK624_131850 [Phanerochaete sordida]
MSDDLCLPPEVWCIVVDHAIYGFLEEYWTCPPNAAALSSEPILPPNPVPNLLAVSSSVRYMTLQAMAEHTGLGYDSEGLGRLDGSAREAVAAVRRLWYPESLKKQNAEVHRLSQLSPTMRVLAHVVAALQQCRGVLLARLDAYEADDASQIATLASPQIIAREQEVLFDSVPNLYANALLLPMESEGGDTPCLRALGARFGSSRGDTSYAKEVEALYESVGLRGDMLSPVSLSLQYKLYLLSCQGYYLTMVHMAYVVYPRHTGLERIPTDELAKDTSFVNVSAYLLHDELELLLESSPTSTIWVRWTQLVDRRNLGRIAIVVNNAEAFIRGTSETPTGLHQSLVSCSGSLEKMMKRMDAPFPG